MSLSLWASNGAGAVPKCGKAISCSAPFECHSTDWGKVCEGWKSTHFSWGSETNA